MSALQHVAVIAAYTVYPLVVFRSIDTPTDVIAGLLSTGFLVLGAGTFLQAWSRVGSGYLCPTTFTATFIGPSLSAIKLGGLPLLFGMTFCSGVLQCALSGMLNRLRPYLPTELSGFVVLMVGITAGVAGMRYMLGTASGPPVTATEWLIAMLTLSLMAGLNVWGTGMLRMLCALIGLVGGYVAAVVSGLVPEQGLAILRAAPLVALPDIAPTGWSFDAALVIPFIIAGLATTLKAIGTVTLCQRINDAEWVRPDMISNRRGVLADGIAIAAAGALGSVGVNTSSANVALVSATGVASRRIAYVVAAMFVGLGLFPKLATVLAVMPRPVMAAALLFATCFLLINGMQIITSRMLDTRRTLVIGLAVVAGLAVEVFPSVFHGTPRFLEPLVGSSLVFGTLVALALNLLFRIGVRKTVRLEVERSTTPTEIEDFFRRQGGAWGARPDVVERAIFGTLQLVETVRESCDPRGPFAVEASFDEFNLDVRVVYDGKLLQFPERRPSNEDIRNTEDGMRRLAGFMMRRNADRIASTTTSGRSTVLFHFDH
ncbi:MAG: uracil-xanthine permease family protein [Rhodospirillaceae bacterium]